MGDSGSGPMQGGDFPSDAEMAEDLSISQQMAAHDLSQVHEDDLYKDEGDDIWYVSIIILYIYYSFG